ncbi:MAG: glycogen/starch synthase [Gammaproteobacteria bacterium]|nr:glycogen/starch synthase [Gammaproteobacteria bacterium]MBT8110696.1 glycogen/starch synthase [Gammaproteobacteria bacterium]NND46880.1 glycosyltransferase [Woeseiaceae bacterium]NNL45395.1 glycosyltransferase [Woeseiaceae bacterium]
MLASENGALRGGKVGGVGDVVRDLPLALAAAGWQISVATPSYGSLHRLPGAARLATVDVDFRGSVHSVDVWGIEVDTSGVKHIVFDHALFAQYGGGRIYHQDEAARPFASDANTFAFFCAAAAQWISASDRRPDVVHLHDWHAAFYLILAKYDGQIAGIRDIRTVFTIHNLAYQGTRPFRGDASSLEAWYQNLQPDYATIVDPRYADCVNPMASAIRLADRVSTVSPTYADEICRPSNPETGFIGGEGLEADLSRARDDGRLNGILNGCYYDQPIGRRPGWQRLLSMIETQLQAWQKEQPSNEAHELALQRLTSLPKRRPSHLMTSIGRLVEQKAALLLHEFDDGGTPLGRIAEAAGRGSVIVVLGSGDPHLEARMLQVAQHTPNLVFLQGYSEDLAAPLYRGGDLFLMPSSFEPCGISQMLAMRSAQPCVVHGVGGLKDTVDDGLTGFVFDGHSPDEQAREFIKTTARALDIRSDDPIAWQNVCQAAAACRFDWAAAAEKTIDTLYGEGNDR